MRRRSTETRDQRAAVEPNETRQIHGVQGEKV